MWRRVALIESVVLTFAACAGIPCFVHPANLCCCRIMKSTGWTCPVFRTMLNWNN